jgi:hypothetical protein
MINSIEEMQGTKESLELVLARMLNGSERVRQAYKLRQWIPIGLLRHRVDHVGRVASTSLAIAGIRMHESSRLQTGVEVGRSRCGCSVDALWSSAVR